MPTGKVMKKNDFDGIKYMLNQGMKIGDIAEISGYCDRTIQRISACTDFDDYSAKKIQWNKRSKADTQDPVPHESLNRDMLKAIIQSIQILAANQSIIISKMDELIKK